MAVTLSAITKFYSDELKLIERAENALASGRLISFTYDGTNGVIKAAVQPSMKKGSYTVMVRFYLLFYRLLTPVGQYGGKMSLPGEGLGSGEIPQWGPEAEPWYMVSGG